MRLESTNSCNILQVERPLFLADDRIKLQRIYTAPEMHINAVSERMKQKTEYETKDIRTDIDDWRISTFRHHEHVCQGCISGLQHR